MCEYNSKAFSRSSILATHMQTHTGDNPHVCETQNSTDAEFNNRRRIQTQDSTTCCEAACFGASHHVSCGKAFSDSGNLS
jgi:hypothetical protein